MSGHKYGPYSKEMKDTLMHVDCVVGYLIEQLKSHHLIDKLNVIMTSDHGMEKLNTDVYLDSYVDINLLNIQGTYPALSVFLNNRTNNQVFPKILFWSF